MQNPIKKNNNGSLTKVPDICNLTNVLAKRTIINNFELSEAEKNARTIKTKNANTRIIPITYPKEKKRQGIKYEDTFQYNAMS